MNAPKFTPGPWKRGKTLLTKITEKWTPEEWAENDKRERQSVFAGFLYGDQGRSRVEIVRGVRTDADAALIAAAPYMYNALEMTLQYLPDVLQEAVMGVLSKARGEA